MPHFNKIVKEIFYVLTGTLSVFVLMELVWPGVVLAYININWVLIIWLIVSIIIIVHDKK